MPTLSLSYDAVELPPLPLDNLHVPRIQIRRWLEESVTALTARRDESARMFVSHQDEHLRISAIECGAAVQAFEQLSELVMSTPTSHPVNVA